MGRTNPAGRRSPSKTPGSTKPTGIKLPEIAHRKRGVYMDEGGLNEPAFGFADGSCSAEPVLQAGAGAYCPL